MDLFAERLRELTSGARRSNMGLAALALVVVLAGGALVMNLGGSDDTDLANTDSAATSRDSVTTQDTQLPAGDQIDTESEDAAPAGEALAEAGVAEPNDTGNVPTPDTEAPSREPVETPPPTPAPTPAPAPAGGPSAEAWANLRDCEASGRYDAVNPAGPYYGAYQFNQGTWDSVAASAGRNDLVGVVPSQAAPADQDAMAYALYASRGAQPWPSCGRFLK